MSQSPTSEATTGVAAHTRAGGCRRWIALVVALFAVLVDMIDNQIVTVALPTIQHQMDATDSSLQWISAAYALGFALTLITGARLGDRFGYTRLFVTGMTVFTLGSLSAGLAPTPELLIAARIAQGVGSGLMVPQVLSFIQTEFGGGEQAKAMTLYTIAFPLGGVAGPLLGGTLTQSNLLGVGWRAIFFVNVPIGILALAGALLTMPKRRAITHHHSDVSGLIMLTLALLAVFFPLIEGRQLGWPWWCVAILVASAPLFAVFYLLQRGSERRGAEPLIASSLLKAPGLAATQAVLFIVNASVAVFFVLTLHLQDALGYSPLQAALTFLPATLGIVAGNMLTFKLGARLGRIWTGVALALLLVSLGTIAALALALGHELNGWVLLAPAIGFGLGMGAAMSSLFGAYFAQVPLHLVGGASGIINTTVQLGTATGIAIFGTIYFGELPTGSASATAWALAAATAIMVIGILITAAVPHKQPEHAD